MPKEIKIVRKSKRRRADIKSTTSKSRVRESLRSLLLDSNRYSPFQPRTLRREIKMEKENLPVAQVQSYNPKNIIGHGIKYIMLPLHLLHFCIYGATSSSVNDEAKKESEKAEEKEPKKETKVQKETEDKPKEEDKKEKKTERSPSPKNQRPKSPNQSPRTPEKLERHDSKSKKEEEEKEKPRTRRTASPSPKKELPKEEVYSDVDDSVDDMVTAPEDSDYSSDHWYSANSIDMNMSVENLEDDNELQSCSVLEEPMDISIDEQNFEKSPSRLKSPKQRKLLDGYCNSFSSTVLLESQENSTRTTDEEIAEIFQKKCTSSDEECYPETSRRITERSRGSAKKDQRYCIQCRKSVNSPKADRRKETPESEKKKKTTSSATQKKTKTTYDEGKESSRRSEERKHDSSENTPSKHRSKTSTTPSRRKESRWEAVRYKEKGTQTDSAFSDEDVEMIPIEGRLERRSHSKTCRSHSFYQLDEMDQDLDYVADNEDSCDGFKRCAKKLFFSDSASSSSTDLGFEDGACTTPERDRKHSNSRVWQNSPGATHRTTAVRAPPGFPERPQNPPLISSGYSDLLPIISDTASQVFQPVAPAPTPMRHLYYDYPEFMDLPANVNRSKILRNILRDNYYQ